MTLSEYERINNIQYSEEEVDLQKKSDKKNNRNSEEEVETKPEVDENLKYYGIILFIFINILRIHGWSSNKAGQGRRTHLKGC